MKHPIELSYMANAMMYQTGMFPRTIANDIKNLAEICRGYDVNEIFVSFLICGKNDY